ncbi:MAG: choice-of-anchor J domain-containing protein [Candidatus Cloacimonetes bacterium]|nr:choice-of-anchor J domain-containing protein [Candidatus Cloacimonadota bacterium]
MKKYFTFLILLAFMVPMFGQWHVDENFDNLTTLPAGWTTRDDGDGSIWRNLNNVSHAHSGTRSVFVDNYLPNQNSDWLITPHLTIASGDSLKFWTRSWTSTENLKVYVSTTGTAVSNFNNQILNLQGIGTTYQMASYNLSAFAGMNIYIGFFWQCSNYAILVDDIRIGQPIVISPELNLPASISFIQGESYSLDCSPYVVATELSSASISWLPTEHVNVSSTGLNLNFSSPDWHGEENIVFTMHDAISGLSATDTMLVTVTPIPVIDLALISISSPRLVEYVNAPFTPKVIISNNGLNQWDDQVLIQYTLRSAAGTTIANSEVFYGGALTPQQTAEVQFPEQTISEAGSYQATFTISAEDGNPANNSITRAFSVVLRINAGGPDAFGFRYLDSTTEGGPVFDWIDISATGTSSIMYGVNQWYGDDNFSEPIPLGFSFPFYGNSYSEAYVDINGEILLATNNWYNHYPSQGWGGDGNMFNYMYPIPGYTQMPGLISVYWDDLEADQGTGNVYFQSFGTSPNAYTVIQWHNLRFRAGTGATSLLDFEVILYENGEIVMQYNHTATGQTGATIPHENGASSTVALQNDNGTIGLCYLREIVQNNTYIGVEPAGNMLFDGLAIRFYSGTDQQAPIITHSAPGNTFEPSPVLKARVIDQSALSAVILMYNTGAGWLEVTGTSTGNNNYEFQMPALPLGSTLTYYIQATDVLNNSSTLPDEDYHSFDILPHVNRSVLLAYSGSQDYQRTELAVYETLLANMNIAYDKYNWEEYDSYSFSSNYSTIIAYASVGSQSPKALNFASVLMNYLDSGSITAPKNLFFASDGWAYSQSGTPNSNTMKQLLNGYLRTDYIGTSLGGGSNGLAGPESLNYQNGTILCLNGSPIGIPGNEYNVYANSPDCLFKNDAVPDWYADMVPYPEIGSQNAFAFEDGPVNGHAYLYHGVCATKVEIPVFKAFYFSFDFSQLSNINQRTALFTDLMDWFGVVPSAIAEDNSPSVQTALKGNYPNPFNPTTTISYTIANPAQVQLSIYNVKGQRVISLLNSQQLAGNHTIIWDGKDDKGYEVGSGIYFIKLSDGKAVVSRKLTLIK